MSFNNSSKQERVHMEVHASRSPSSTSSKTVSHKTVPRWLRMSTRVALLVGVISVAALATKNPEFENLFKYRSYSIAFMVLGTLVLPVWEPNLGMIVVMFTVLIPMAAVSIWLAYGLFLGCSNIIFMMGACVAVTFSVLFTSELLSLPAGMLSVFTTIFVACANVFVQTPAMAKVTAMMLTVLLFVAAFLATIVCWLVFPEFCVDEVIRYHHEGLEHLLHLAHHALRSRPPPLLKRVASSHASRYGEGAKWREILHSADEQAQEPAAAMLASGKPDGLARTADAQQSAGDDDSIKASYLVERTWQRVHMAFRAAAKAQVGAKAEVVLAAVVHKRIIVPCVPLIPCAKGQMNEQALQALQHVAVATSLQIYKIYSATHPLDEATSDLMHQVLSSRQWAGMRTALLAALQELVDAFPMDYYPTDSAPNQQHLQDFQAAVDGLAAAWQRRQLEHKDEANSSNRTKQEADGTVSHAVTISSSAEAAAGVLDVPKGNMFAEALVPVDSAAASALAWLNVGMIVKMLNELAEQLQHLYSIASAVSGSMMRFKCC